MSMLLLAFAGTIMGTVVVVLLYYLDHGPKGMADRCPDANRYAMMANGAKGEKPFCYRWLIPHLINKLFKKGRAAKLKWASLGALVLCFPVLALVLYTRGFGWTQALLGTLFFAGVSGIVRTNIRLGGLIDPFAVLFMLLAVFVYPFSPAGGILIAMFGAWISEKVPIFAALAFGDFPLLLGMMFYFVSLMAITPQKTDHPALREPMKTARNYRSLDFMNIYITILPWGVLLVGLLYPSPWLVMSLMAGYAMTFLATDSIRVYQWAFLPMLVATMHILPEGWWFAAIALNFFNPYATKSRIQKSQINRIMGGV